MINLDANAGVPATPEAVATYREVAADFANPSSAHQLGKRAAARLQQARREVAEALGADPQEVIFCSGGSEANALALLGVIRAGRESGQGVAGVRQHVVSTTIEHPSVANTLLQIEARGEIDLTSIVVGRHGAVAAGDIAAALREETGLVSVMAANHETGVIQPLAEVVAVVADHNAGSRKIRALLHSDAVQAIGRVDLPSAGIDLLSLSGHKLGAVGGIGALVVRGDVELAPILVGGGQERGWRASTENVAGAASLAAALAAGHGPDEQQRLAGLRERLEAGLLANANALGIASEVLGVSSRRLANTTCVLFRDISGEALMMALDQAGVAISTGSACSVGATEPSPILRGMGLTSVEAEAAVRFSLPWEITAEEIDRAVAATREVLARMVRSRG